MSTSAKTEYREVQVRKYRLPPSRTGPIAHRSNRPMERLARSSQRDVKRARNCRQSFLPPTVRLARRAIAFHRTRPDRQRSNSIATGNHFDNSRKPQSRRWKEAFGRRRPPGNQIQSRSRPAEDTANEKIRKNGVRSDSSLSSRRGTHVHHSAHLS